MIRKLERLRLISRISLRPGAWIVPTTTRGRAREGASRTFSTPQTQKFRATRAWLVPGAFPPNSPPPRTAAVTPREPMPPPQSYAAKMLRRDPRDHHGKHHHCIEMPVSTVARTRPRKRVRNVRQLDRAIQYIVAPIATRERNEHHRQDRLVGCTLNSMYDQPSTETNANDVLILAKFS